MLVVVSDQSQGFTHQDCQIETFLQTLHEGFAKAGSHQHNSKEIKIYRIDIGLKSRLKNQERDMFKTTPAIFLVK